MQAAVLVEDPVVAVLSKLTETQQLILKYAWRVFVWIICEVWFWVSNRLHFFTLPLELALRWNQYPDGDAHARSNYLGTWKEHL